MSERARAAVGTVALLAVLAVLAGCSSLPVGAQQRSTATLTTSDDRRVRLNRHVRFSKVDATNVSRPVWYWKAKNATSSS